MRYVWLAGLVVLVGVGTPRQAEGQEPEAPDLINLYVDCNAPGCRDEDFLRREIPFVNWVRDREVADVHVLVTSESTGGGGRLFTLDFIGLGDFEETSQELTHSTAGDATSDEMRTAVAERIKLGLVPYVQTTSAADRLRVVFGDVTGGGAGGGPGGQGGGAPGATPQDDPWDFWVFRISGNGFLNGQATTSQSNLFSRVSANRTTERWKLELTGNFSRQVQSFETNDGTIEEISLNWGTDVELVRSVGPQWSVGIRADVGSSTFVNQDLRWSVKPGVEYNFFPYSESSRRSLTLQYLVGPNYFAYNERTIFNEKFETVAQQVLSADLSLVEQWGRWSTSLTSRQYLHDPEKYSVTLSGNFNIRLFQGFSIRMGGNYSWIRDQLFISAEGITNEQILLRQRQLETSYRYFTSFGIEYRFGSIFNNVVNPRFGGSGGGDVFFF